MNTQEKTDTGFLPEGYQQPKSNANYFKFEKGENKFRILSRPIVGWLDWGDKKPLRFEMANKPKLVDPKKTVKHFWAFAVWSYKTESIQVLEITQASIQAAITALTKDEDWGSPFGYDIKVNRSGEGMETEYTVNPVPHKKLSLEIEKIASETPVNLTALFVGEDPFTYELPF